MCATWTPFRAPIPTISYFVLLGFSPEKFEKVFNSFINSIIEFISLRYKVVSSTKVVYRNLCLKILKLLTLGLFVTNIKNVSKRNLNKYADIGSPCWAPLSNLRQFVVFPLLMMQDSCFVFLNRFNPTNKIYPKSKFFKNSQ